MKLTVVFLTLLALAGCSSEEKTEEGGTVAAECMVVAPPMLSDLGLSTAAATKENVEKGPGLNRKGQRWFVATADGALWVTNIDVTGPDESGLTYPLNDEARSKSEVGADVEVSTLEDVTAVSPGAVKAQECARK